MQARTFRENFRQDLQKLRTKPEYREFLGSNEVDVIKSLYETKKHILLYLDQQQVVETLDNSDFLVATKDYLRTGGKLEVLVDDTTLTPENFPVPILHTKGRWWNDRIKKNIHFIVAFGFSAFKVEGESKRFCEFGTTESESTTAYILGWDELLKGKRP